jgi:ABC-type nitrate/sulfonate/bicarbonate transport system substrate-binding protein
MKFFISLFGLLLFVVILIYQTDIFDKPVSKESVSIAVSRTPLSAPIYIADELGLFNNNGIEANLIEVVGGKRSFNKVMAKEADFGTSSDSVLMFEALKNTQYVNLASFVQADNDIKLLILNNHGIRSIADLSGKKIGVIKGSASDYFISILLALDNLTINDVELVSIAPNKMLEALQTEAVQAVATWEPYAFEIRKKLSNDIFIIATKNIYSLSFNLITQKDHSDKQINRNARVLTAIDQAIEFIIEQPEQAQQILQNRLALDQDFIKWIWPDYLYRLSLNKSLLLTLENEAQWAMKSGLSLQKEMADFEHFIDIRPLLKVRKSAVSL